MPSITFQPPLLLTALERPPETAPAAMSTAMVVFQRTAGESIPPDATRSALDANQQATARELEQTVGAPHGMRAILDCGSEQGAHTPDPPMGSHDKPTQGPPPAGAWRAAVPTRNKSPGGDGAASERSTHELGVHRAFAPKVMPRAVARETLGFEKGARLDEELVKRAYKREALKHHPDRHNTAPEDQRKAAEQKFKAVAEAYEVLMREVRPRPEPAS